MKKLLFIAALFISTGLFAQKGSWYIGGAVGFSTSTQKASGISTTKANSWSFSPEIGTFLSNHIQLGLGITTNGGSIEAGNSKTTSMRYGGTLYSRYFFGTTAFKPFVAVNVSVLPGTDVTKNLNPPTTSTTNNTFNFGTNLNIGFAYALNSKFTAVGSFGLVGYSMSRSGGTTKSGFDMNLSSLGNRFTIGVYYTFLPAKE